MMSKRNLLRSARLAAAGLPRLARDHTDQPGPGARSLEYRRGRAYLRPVVWDELHGEYGFIVDRGGPRWKARFQKPSP
jgi:hypothetical protein